MLWVLKNRLKETLPYYTHDRFLYVCLNNLVLKLKISKKERKKEKKKKERKKERTKPLFVHTNIYIC